MIYTMTLNPAIDYYVKTENFRLHQTNRVTHSYSKAGGKGINVARVLQLQEVPVMALGYLAGARGKEIKQEVETWGLATHWIESDRGNSRLNIKLLSEEGTEINGQGPEISEKDLLRVESILYQAEEGDYLVLSGSVPCGVPDTIYGKWTQDARARGVSVIVDASGELLRQTIQHKPFLIKPNRAEAEELLGQTIANRIEAKKAAEAIREMGAENVLLSLGKDGAVLAAMDGSLYYQEAKPVDVINTVGAGDALLAGFLASYMEDHNPKNALQQAIEIAGAMIS